MFPSVGDHCNSVAHTSNEDRNPTLTPIGKSVSKNSASLSAIAAVYWQQTIRTPELKDGSGFTN
jgi:hypothetical protein